MLMTGMYSGIPLAHQLQVHAGGRGGGLFMNLGYKRKLGLNERNR